MACRAAACGIGDGGVERGSSDDVVVSHFDVDHIGDVPALAARIPIRHIVDHGKLQLAPPLAAAPGNATQAPNRGGGGGPAAALDRFSAYTALRKTIDHKVVI